MRILMTGATGYLGGAIATRLKAGGHEVRGLARSERAIEALRAAGIAPVPGALSDHDVLRDEALRADGVVHAAFQSDEMDFERGGRLDAAAVGVLLGALRGSGKPLVYTSGTLVLGDTGQDVLDERSTPRPSPFVAWRLEVERQVAASCADGVVATVVRPPLVYGAAGNRMLAILRDVSLQVCAGIVIGDGANRWSTVHVEDLATLYELVLTRPPRSAVVIAESGEIRLEDLGRALSRLLGFEGEVVRWSLDEAARVLGPLAAVIAIDQRVHAAYARSLGWRPERPSLLDELASGSYLAWRPR